jgi:hypothetical protein
MTVPVPGSVATLPREGDRVRHWRLACLALAPAWVPAMKASWTETERRRRPCGCLPVSGLLTGDRVRSLVAERPIRLPITRLPRTRRLHLKRWRELTDSQAAGSAMSRHRPHDASVPGLGGPPFRGLPRSQVVLSARCVSGSWRRPSSPGFSSRGETGKAGVR